MIIRVKINELGVYENLVDYYLEINNSEKAVFYLRKVNALKDSLNNPLTMYNIANIQHSYNSKQRKREELMKYELLTKKQTLKKYQFYGWIGLLGLLLSIAIAILYRQRNKMRIKEISLLKIETEKQKITDELKFKNNELAS